MKVPQASVELDEGELVQHRIVNHVWGHGGDHCGCCDCLTCGNCWACGDCPCPAPDLIDPAGRDCEVPSWHARPGDDDYRGPAEAPFPELLEAA